MKRTENIGYDNGHYCLGNTKRDSSLSAPDGHKQSKGIIPSQSMIMNYMDRTTEKVKVILDRIEKEKTYDSYFTLVTLEYNWDEFIKHNKSISKWFQKLSNSKAKTEGS